MAGKTGKTGKTGKNKKVKKSKEKQNQQKEISRLERIIDSFEKRREYSIPDKRKTKRFGVIGDTHIGSLYERVDALHEFYKLLKKEGIKTVLHAGDMLAGHKVYRGQEFEVYALGFEQQLESLLKNYPNNGITTFFITGNHDDSYRRDSGINVGKEIKRKDLVYLGHESARINIGKGKYELLHPSGGTSYAICVDNKTEILTENGWKLFKDLNKGESVATLNPKTHTFEWQKPEDYIEQNYNGEMLHFKARTFDLMVTPNHRMLVRKYPKHRNHRKNLLFPQKSHKKVNWEWQLIPAEELNGCRQSWQMMRNCKNFHGIGGWDDDFMKLFGWYISEGCCHKNGKQSIITQCQKHNPENYDEIKNTLSNLGIKFGCYGRNGKDITISNKKIATFLKENFGRISKEKKIPKQIKEMEKYKLEILIKTLIKGDGWINGKGFGYKSYSNRLLDDVQEIAIKCGYGTTRSKDTVCLTMIQNYPTINEKPNKINYNGKIYCVKVPNEIILVRRNGKAIWTGNSYKSQKIIEAFSGGQKPNAVFIGHYHKADHMPCFRNVQALQVGCFESQTPYMKRKPTPAHVGGWIVEDTISDKLSNRFKAEFIAFYEPQS